MLRFRQMSGLQKFASVHANVHNYFSLERHLTDRQTYKDLPASKTDVHPVESGSRQTDSPSASAWSDPSM